MRVTADTNVLVRVAVQDDVAQAARAAKLLESASQVVVPIPVLCEFVWVLKKVYAFGNAQVAHAVRQLMEAPTVVADRAAVSLGLEVLEAGGDFADGAIAQMGIAAGGDTFVSFDAAAVKRLARAGVKTKLL
jgi:predicted nucleic-acid-binding protein